MVSFEKSIYVIHWDMPFKNLMMKKINSWSDEARIIMIFFLSEIHYITVKWPSGSNCFIMLSKNIDGKDK